MPIGQWTPPDAGPKAPKEVKDILREVYSSCRDKNPAETNQSKSKCARMAWGAVKNAGWRKNPDGSYYKLPSSRKTIS